MISPADWEGENISDIEREYSYEDIEEGLSDNGLNTCDRCGLILRTTDLVWITYDELEGIFPKWAYEHFDALCEWCHKEVEKMPTYEYYIENEI